MLPALPLGEQGVLQLQLENIETFSGRIQIAIFDNEQAFEEKGKPVWNKVIHELESATIVLELDDIPFGIYAVALYHDLNDNDQLDKNSFGIPTEPYAFSNNPKVKWKAPSFTESKFHFSKTNQRLQLTLKKWSKH
jgi:uncharacterized protein (DUF2141 family)